MILMLGHLVTTLAAIFLMDDRRLSSYFLQFNVESVTIVMSGSRVGRGLKPFLGTQLHACPNSLYQLLIVI